MEDHTEALEVGQLSLNIAAAGLQSRNSCSDPHEDKQYEANMHSTSCKPPGNPACLSRDFAKAS